MAGFDFAADAVPNTGKMRLGGEVRLDGRAPRRQLIKDGGVEIAVEGERKRARNRGSGEDKNMGRVAVGGGFVHQALALHDAEAVLFVNRDETEARELDVVFDEGVRAHYELGLTGTNTLEGGGFFGRFQ